MIERTYLFGVAMTCIIVQCIKNETKYVLKDYHLNESFNSENNCAVISEILTNICVIIQNHNSIDIVYEVPTNITVN